MLPTTPGLPLLPLASMLGVGSGMVGRSIANRRIYRRLTASAHSEFATTAAAARADLLLHPHDALEHPAAAHGASWAAVALASPTTFLSDSDRRLPSELQWRVPGRTSAFRGKLDLLKRDATGDVPDLV